MKKFYITTPIYYASGKPHFGHAFNALYVDVLARWKRMNGYEVFFSTGTDEHGSKIAELAGAQNKPPQDFVDEISEHYKNAWQKLNVQYDGFIRTTSEQHKEGVLKIIKKVYEKGDIYEDFYEGLYCVGCENFITEKSLVDGLCPDHLRAPEKIKEKNYFFNLKKYLPEVKEKIINGELNIVPESRKNEVLRIIEDGIPDFSVTREKVKWGIPFPYNKNQAIYVWVEALMNYVTVLDFPDGQNYKDFWPADVHIIGAEINKFHSIFWPAMLLSAELPLPKNIFVHGLFTVNGQKMSKTIGNVIDPLEMVDKFGVGATRYLLLSQFSALEHGDIKQSDFTQKYNDDLSKGIGNLLERVFAMVINYRGGVVKDYAALDKDLIDAAVETEDSYNGHMEDYRLFDALKDIFAFIKVLDKYINDESPWDLRKNKQEEKLDEVLASLLFGAEKVILWLEPFIPLKVEAAREYVLKMKNGETIKDGERIRLNLFPKIER